MTYTEMDIVNEAERLGIPTSVQRTGDGTTRYHFLAPTGTEAWIARGEREAMAFLQGVVIGTRYY